MDMNPGCDTTSPERLNIQLDPHEAPPLELKNIFKSWSGNLIHPRLSGILDLTSGNLPGSDSIPKKHYHEVLRLFMMKSCSRKALRQKLSLKPVCGNFGFDASQLEELTVPLYFNSEEAPIFLPDDLNASVYSCHKIPGR